MVEPQISWQSLGADMPLLIIGIIALFVFLVIKHLSIPTSSSCDTNRLHPEQSSEECRNSGQLKSADVSSSTDRIDLFRIELDPSVLPAKFVVFDLETTGLDAARDEIIEIGAVRVDRNVDLDATFRTLVKPANRIPRMITRINGISQAMVDNEGIPLAQAIQQFSDFIQDLPLVSFNAQFDMGFLQNAAKRQNLVINNPASCALEMARAAWPGRKSYKLCDLAKDAGMSQAGMHHALADCKLALFIYVAAASILGTATVDEPIPEIQLISPRMQAFRKNSCIPTDPVERNLLGMELEADGEIDTAIECYQANVRDGFDGTHPYDRLAIIYRRRKDVASEVAVLTRAIEVLSHLPTSSRSDVAAKLEKMKKRLDRVSGHSGTEPAPAA
jgi:DNA polymerase III epsilon subunit family exonuclease